MQMARAPFQVLVYPYRKLNNEHFEYALMERADDGTWQGIAGGGEDGETPFEAAVRETYEEAGLSPASQFMRLDSIESVPTAGFRDSHIWGEKCVCHSTTFLWRSRTRRSDYNFA